jgi:hypothetical protein
MCALLRVNGTFFLSYSTASACDCGPSARGRTNRKRLTHCGRRVCCAPTHPVARCLIRAAPAMLRAGDSRVYSTLPFRPGVWVSLASNFVNTDLHEGCTIGYATQVTMQGHSKDPGQDLESQELTSVDPQVPHRPHTASTAYRIREIPS